MPPRKPRAVETSSAPGAAGLVRRSDDSVTPLYRNENALNFCRRCGRQLLLTELYTLADVGQQAAVPCCKTCRPWTRIP